MQRDSWSAQTPIGAIADLLTPFSNAGSFNEMQQGPNAGLRQTDFFIWDMSDMIERAEQLIASGDMPIFNPGNLDFGRCGTALCPSDNFTTDKATSEDTTAAYFQVNAATEIGDKPVSMRLGLRYEQTDVKSAVFYPQYTGLSWVSGNEKSPTNNGESVSETESSDYNYLLPNFDFKIELTEDLVARASLSKTLTRQDFTNIQGGLTIDSPVRVEGGTGFIGDPSLKPLESDNFDLSVEYYYGEGSYLSAGYFYKDVKNFVTTQVSNQTPFNLPDPQGGPLADAARDALGAPQPPEIYNWILENLPDAEGVDADRGIIAGVDGRDPATNFALRIPQNSETTSVDGWELNLQHAFGDTGFGFILNATFVSADEEFDNNDLSGQFILPGLSDSANFVPYWENEDWSIRLAYNWRDTFLAGTGQGAVGGVGPVFVDEYEQWDLSASYWATDNLQFYADVLNLTNETTWVHGRQKDQILYASQYGTRYAVGVRYKF